MARSVYCALSVVCFVIVFLQLGGAYIDLYYLQELCEADSEEEF